MTANLQDALEQRVLDFVQEWSGCSHATLDSSVSQELGVFGIDAFRMIEQFSREFDVDMSSFVLERHFYAEESVSILGLLLLPYVALFAVSPRWMKKILPNPFGTKDEMPAPLKVSDLVAIANSHKWCA